ncbi:MAG: methyltransferase domain-containing protein [Candidatus Hydrogenedentes bacterium]|nr:methyltransferase domain-containing protein [Candidatus Hydrogenedentota bacterium]
MAHPDKAQVQAHYADLAKSYGVKSNKACNASYIALAKAHLSPCHRVLEIGAGSALLVQHLDAPVRVAADFSVPMLQQATADPAVLRVGGDAQRLPFPDRAFDGILSINVLEHVPDSGAMLEEAARVLAPGGTLVAVTPNGDMEWLLDLLERLRLKLPEGPHEFLGTEALRDLVPDGCTLVAHQCFLAFPAGPLPFVIFADAWANGWGLFQYLVIRKGS